MVAYTQKALNNFFVELTNECIKGGKAYYFEEIVKGIGSLTLEKSGIPMRKNNIPFVMTNPILRTLRLGYFVLPLAMV